MRKSLLPKEVYAERRRRLGSLISGSAVVLPAWPEQIRNHDGHFRYRQESNLLYLTGFDEPGSCLIFRPGQIPETVLFVREKNVERETWDGFRFGPEGAKKVFGVDEAYTISQFEEVAPRLLKSCDKVYYSLFKNKAFDQVFGRALDVARGLNPRSGLGLLPVEDAYGLLGELRIKKSEFEIEAMKTACEITAQAHLEVFRAAKPGISERELHGLFLYSIMKQGAFGEAYNGIFASGVSAVTLHYNFNENTLQDGDLLLVDAGAEYMYYSGDITRTYPVGGRFTEPQKAIYEGVLAIQKKTIEMIKPGLPHVELQKETVSGLVDVLLENKIMRGSKEEIISSGSYRKYYPHGVSHLLGLDTHDAGGLVVHGQPRQMEAGWVFTMEPGLYIPADDESVPKEFRGIGVRIEDDILVTEGGYLNMTAGMPKETKDLEK